MKKIIKDIIRKNKYIEMLAYIVQNNKFLNSSGEGEFDDNIDGIYQHNINIAQQYANNYKNNLEDKTVLEIGTGFTRATMLYMIKEHNLKKVYCYDRFNCLHENDEKIINKYDLEKYLDRLEYISGENEEITKNIEENSVDYIVSNAVLEHVYDLELLFSNLNNVLSSDGSMYHKVDLRCHNRFKNHGELYFHTFANKAWNLMGDKIGQPNRKLLDDYIELFNRLDFKCDVNVVERFAEEELLRAKQYLGKSDVSMYEISIAEFTLCKK